MDVTIPAPSGSTDAAASQVTTQAEQTTTTTPQAEKPAGDAAPQAETPAGQDAASDPSQDDPDKPKTWKEKRQERNRQRWQEYKQAKEFSLSRLSHLENEVARLRGAKAPDFDQITDPQEELAERTAWKVRQAQADERQTQLDQERRYAAAVNLDKLSQAWTEQADDARTRIPDFDAVVTDKTAIHQRAVPFIVESEKGAEIAYWLGKNPQAAQELFRKFESAPAQALVELGRIEGRLTTPEPKRISTAPKPAQTLSGGVNPLAFDANLASVDDMATQLRKAGLIR